MGSGQSGLGPPLEGLADVLGATSDRGPSRDVVASLTSNVGRLPGGYVEAVEGGPREGIGGGARAAPDPGA
ncbi:hypothetical protein NDU88_009304 [Pleurodeles waltl]|uniref:Uncharacterized protein n=1 Tax=Pleurodeles waltl TaxID=8319 RepID=A0AAV7QR63_PLEWA|nr:hypothetical protein NDU88_009304 [Pleurodeles waltl]